MGESREIEALLTLLQVIFVDMKVKFVILEPDLHRTTPCEHLMLPVHLLCICLENWRHFPHR